jgi:YidC/Oxa1 family membrane protein insertase
MWNAAIEALRALIFGLGHLTGSLGAAILLTSLALRLVLLPLSLRLARRARDQATKLAALRPELERLRQTHAKDPVRLHEATLALFRAHDYQPVDGRALLGNLVQLPVLSAMFAALRTGVGSGTAFAWIANLARPDTLLILLVTALYGVAATLGAPAGTTKGALVASLVVTSTVTVAFLAHTSSAMGLSMAASGLVNLAQSWWLRRSPRAAV